MKTNLKTLKGWELPDLMEFLQMIRLSVRDAGFEIGLTGSVLFNGQSSNDADIIIYPRNCSVYNLKDLYYTLEKLGLKREFTHSEILKIWERKDSTDIKHVEVWSFDGHRIDIFLLK